jgi:predicted chitinase
LRYDRRRGLFRLLVSASNGCLSLADQWDIDAITRRVNGDAMEAAGLRRRSSDNMVTSLRQYAAAAQS